MTGATAGQPQPSTEHLKVSHHNEIALLEIGRPSRRNAVTLRMWQDIPTVLSLAFQPSTRCLVVTGAGGDFSTGADVSEFGELRTGDIAERYSEAVAQAMRAIVEFPVPTIAAIEGYCVGGGCEIAVACDIRVASERASLGVTAAKLGVIYSLDSTRRLAALVGPGWTRYLLLTAKLLPAERALAIGLVHEIHPGDLVLPAALKLAESVAGLAPVSLKGSRRVLDAIGAGAFDENEQITALYTESYNSPDYQQRVHDFLHRA